MASLIPSQQPRRGTERVRHELLIALHFGNLNPGDQVPSVRRLADRTGMNRKTVHRAYRRLAQEGLLDVRPGSGTFVAETIPPTHGSATVADLLSAINRCRASAEELGLSPARLAAFLSTFLGDGLRGIRLVAAECNREQLGLIASELEVALGLDVRPVLLSDLSARPERVLDGRLGVVTTDCHQSEVAALMAPRGIPVYRVALDPRFPRQLAERARRGPVLLVVRDRGFVPVLRRLLAQMAVPDEVVERLRIVEPRMLGRTLAGAEPDTLVCVSPIAGPIPAGRIPERFRRVHARWHIEPGSLDRFRAALAMDLVSREAQRSSSMPS